MRNAMQVCEAFSLLAELAMKDGADKQPLAQFWERDIGRWHVSLNRENISRKNEAGDDVPPYTAVVTFNGWPAGMIDPRGGIIAAGAAANEDTFIAAIKEQLSNSQRAET
jgi:hypothetical protein